jgi:hypothetical protein
VKNCYLTCKRVKTDQLTSYIRGFESDSPESLGKNNYFFNRKSRIRTYRYLVQYGFIHNFNRETSYSALVICDRK